MAGKRNKGKKAPAPVAQAPPIPVQQDEQLMNDLFAELDSRDQSVQQEGSVEEQQGTHSVDEIESAPKKKDSKARHLARQARKAATLAQHFTPSNPEVDAELEREAKQETASIKRICDELGVQVYEINPDGHCLFSAIADQLVILDILSSNQANYAVVRAVAAEYMFRHPDDFLPFLPSISGEDGVGATEDTGLMTLRQFEQYCSSIRNTSAWGGEPEIRALSRAYSVPILVIQGGNPAVVVHSLDGVPLDPMDRHAKVARISFHRRKYGLGEHYNSLRPKSTFTAVTDKIQSILS